MKKIAFIFPGQGAQYPGMGKSFYDSHLIAKECFQEADDLLHRSLSKVIFEGPEDLLTKSSNCQLAIFVTSIALLRTVESLFPHLTPQVTSGLSLGEYAALVAAKKISFKEALSLVYDRGRFMDEACLERKGVMAVVMGLTSQVVDETVKNLNFKSDIFVANYNCPGQVVISGTEKGVESASKALLEVGAKRVLPLNVAGAFHSGLMQSASDKLHHSIAKTEFTISEIPCVMNVPGDYVNDLLLIPGFLERQVTHSVKWEMGVQKMDQKGIECYIEIGCGKVLNGLNRKIGVAGVTHSIENIEDLEKLADIQ